MERVQESGLQEIEGLIPFTIIFRNPVLLVNYVQNQRKHILGVGMHTGLFNGRYTKEVVLLMRVPSLTLYRLKHRFYGVLS